MIYTGTLEKNNGLGNGYYIFDQQNGASPIQRTGYKCEKKCKQPDGEVIWLEDEFCDRLSANVVDAPKPIVRAEM